VIRGWSDELGEGGAGLTYLVLVEDSAEGIEELEGRYDLALYKGRGEHCCCRPPAGAEGHFPEPGFEGEAGLASHAAVSCAHHLVHIFFVFRGEIVELLVVRGSHGGESVEEVEAVSLGTGIIEVASSDWYGVDNRGVIETEYNVIAQPH